MELELEALGFDRESVIEWEGNKRREERAVKALGVQ